MAKYTANRDARSKVQQRLSFRSKNGNLFGLNTVVFDLYVVYSYGYHWPLFIYVKSIDRWFENTDKYGVTTSKHHSQTHPHTETTGLSCDDMRLLADHGYDALARKLVVR